MRLPKAMEPVTASYQRAGGAPTGAYNLCLACEVAVDGMTELTGYAPQVLCVYHYNAWKSPESRPPGLAWDTWVRTQHGKGELRAAPTARVQDLFWPLTIGGFR